MDNEDIKIIEDDYTAEELHRLFLTYLRCQEHIKGMTSSPEQADLMEMVELAGEYICLFRTPCLLQDDLGVSGKCRSQCLVGADTMLSARTDI